MRAFVKKRIKCTVPGLIHIPTTLSRNPCPSRGKVPRNRGTCAEGRGRYRIISAGTSEIAMEGASDAPFMNSNSTGQACRRIVHTRQRVSVVIASTCRIFSHCFILCFNSLACTISEIVHRRSYTVNINVRLRIDVGTSARVQEAIETRLLGPRPRNPSMKDKARVEPYCL